MNYPPLNNAEKVPLLFESLIAREIPNKFTFRFLEGIGFPSSSDRPLIGLLQFLGAIDNQGLPTQEYVLLRDQKNLHRNIGKLVSKSYKELFAQNKNADTLSVEELVPLFLKDTPVDITIARKYARTFKALCAFSSFDEEEVAVSETRKKKEVNISLSINLPISTDPKFYKEVLRNIMEGLGEE